ELVDGAVAGELRGLFERRGLEDESTGHEVLGLRVRTVREGAVAATNRLRSIVERVADVRATRLRARVGPAIPLRQVLLHLHRREALGNESAAAKDVHESGHGSAPGVGCPMSSIAPGRVTAVAKKRSRSVSGSVGRSSSSR